MNQIPEHPIKVKPERMANGFLTGRVVVTASSPHLSEAYAFCHDHAADHVQWYGRDRGLLPYAEAKWAFTPRDPDLLHNWKRLWLEHLKT